ncbi:UDP-3-O-(3-hydroxymyristoyl)glucosamine N-acyltransferase [Thermodesulfobacteriota bacterium]
MEITLGHISEIVSGELKGNPEKIIRNVAPFETASADDITYAGGAKYLKQLIHCKAGAVIVPKDVACESGNLIFVDHPQVAFAKIMRLFYPLHQKNYGPGSPHYKGKHVTCGKDVSIAPYAVIQDNVTIGDRVTIHPHVVIGDDVAIGDDVVIYPNVTIMDRCRIGSRVIIHAGSVIGSDGFGFAPDGEIYHKIQQTGIVQIDDDVEIGACNTIDRATFGKTWIQKGVKTDNLVQIAHNVTIGEHTVIVAQVGISGSVTIGKHVVLAGQAAVSGHLEIGDNVIVGPRGGISKSIPAGQVVSGGPEMPHKQWLRVQRVIPRLPELKKKIADLEKRINQIEKKKNR